MSDFKERLSIAMSLRDMTVTELSEKSEIAQPKITCYKNGKYEPNARALVSLAKALNVREEWLLGDTNEMERNPLASGYKTEEDLQDIFTQAMRKGMEVIGVTSNGKKIPIYGKVSAGIPIEAIQDIIGYETISDDMARNGDYVALQIQGESMSPKISDGDIVIIRLQKDFEDGDVVVAFVDDENATCKNIKRINGGVALVPNNPNFQPMFFFGNDCNRVSVMGKVVQCRSNF